MRKYVYYNIICLKFILSLKFSEYVDANLPTWGPGWACRSSCVVCPSSRPTAWPTSQGPWWQTRPTPLPSRWPRPRLGPVARGGSAKAGSVGSRATTWVCRPSQETALLEKQLGNNKESQQSKIQWCAFELRLLIHFSQEATNHTLICWVNILHYWLKLDEKPEVDAVAMQVRKHEL